MFRYNKVALETSIEHETSSSYTNSPTSKARRVVSLKNCPSTVKWVPPKRREQLTQKEIIFRKIRGQVKCIIITSKWCHIFIFCSVLNKLTPDNFDRLVTDLANYIVGYDRETLKGAILLVRLAYIIVYLQCMYNGHVHVHYTCESVQITCM